VNRKLDRAVMSRLLWTLFRLGGEYLSQVSWAATPSPALVGNPKTHWSEILRQRPVLEPAILPRTVPVPPKATFASAKQMSALGQKQTFPLVRPMSRFTSKSGHQSEKRFNELPDLDHFLRSAAVPVIAIPLAFRRAQHCTPLSF